MAVSAAMAMIVSAALARAVTANDLTTPPTQTLTYITLPLGRRSRLCHILTKTSRRDQEQPIIPVEGMGFGDMCDGRLYCRKFESPSTAGGNGAIGGAQVAPGSSPRVWGFAGGTPGCYLSMRVGGLSYYFCTYSS